MKRNSFFILMVLCSFVFVKAASINSSTYCAMSVSGNIVSVAASNVTDTIDMAMGLDYVLESLKANKCGASDQSNPTSISNLQSDEKSKGIELCPDTKLRLFFAHSAVLSTSNLIKFLGELQNIGWLEKVEIISLDGVAGAPAAVRQQFQALLIDAGNCVLRNSLQHIHTAVNV